MLAVIVVSALVSWVGGMVVHRCLPDADPAAKLGIGGVLGLGLCGTFCGLGAIVSAPGGALVGFVIALALLAIIGLRGYSKDGLRLAYTIPKGVEALLALAIGLAVLFALVGALAPSTALDWDSLAYHLAVPKLWLIAGHAYSVPYIHHSNFPAAVDSLFLLREGVEQAKVFMTAYMFFGVLCVFGLTRGRFGRTAGWWAALGFATIPLVMWESGTAYIDIPHGLFAGLGFCFAARLAVDPKNRPALWLAAISLSFAAGSKYTGLLSIGIAFATIAILTTRKPGGFKAAVLLAVIAGVFASPWYVRNIIWTGNPVYPFFYSKLGGRGWDQRRADIYQHEQNTFGLGREPVSPEHPDLGSNKISPLRLGHSVLGLAYAPGRYVNPSQMDGRGDPAGSIGVVLIVSLLAWMFSGKAKGEERALVLASLLTFLAWFVVSQQVRYLSALFLPMALLLGAGIVRLKLGKVIAGLAVAQAIYSLFLIYNHNVFGQLRVVLGQVSADEYQARGIPFYRAAKEINNLHANKVLLYNEVFGYLLDVPYVWANPGHSTLMDYDHMTNGDAFAAGAQALGADYVYFNLMPMDAGVAKRWLEAAGLTPGGTPFSANEKAGLLGSFENRFLFLVADAVRTGRLHVVDEAQTRDGQILWVLLKCS
jgi:4-amino-4-deoxy-L-arabinose transferase-like glycosyltransferase